MRLKTNSSCIPYYNFLEAGKLDKMRLDRTTRYFISKNGGTLVKDFGDNRVVGVNVGYSVTLFNTFYESNNYGINYQFYIAEANKIKNTIDDGQLSLF
jgi:hypothetical protein